MIEDPIPKGTTYLANSANGEAEITFSSDKGKTFAPPVRLTYEVKLPSGAVEKRVAVAARETLQAAGIPPRPAPIHALATA